MKGAMKGTKHSGFLFPECMPPHLRELWCSSQQAFTFIQSEGRDHVVLGLVCCARIRLVIGIKDEGVSLLPWCLAKKVPRVSIYLVYEVDDGIYFVFEMWVCKA